VKVVTTGSSHVDIDAYGGCVAYAELLRLQGHDAVAMSTAALNESIPATVRSWQVPWQNEYVPADTDTFILIDVSEPDYLEKTIIPEKVEEVIDHHAGFEQYWHDRIGDKADIEFIGAACTQVYERWKSAGLMSKMSVISARLLVCGILDNTLNFGAKVTTPRDVAAYAALMAIAQLPEDWPAQYFTECQQSILADASAAIKNDVKRLSFKSFGRPIYFGQLAVWDAPAVLAAHEDRLKKTMADMQAEWCINLISIGEAKSYLLSDNAEVQQFFAKLVDVRFQNAVAVADQLWLRKEIIKKDLTSL
jgi:inorganic pyrophosphatase